MLKRFWIGAFLLLGLVSLGLYSYVYWQKSQPADYTCLTFDNVMVQFDRSLYVAKPAFPYGDPVISPDGKFAIQLRYLWKDSHQNHKIIMTNLQTGKYTVVHNQVQELRQVIWSPQSNGALIEWNKTGIGIQLSAVNVAGQVLWSGESHGFNSQWASYGTYLAIVYYLSQAEMITQTNLLMINFQTSEVKLLDHLDQFKFDTLTWSPNNQYLSLIDGASLVVINSLTNDLYTTPLYIDTTGIGLMWSPNSTHLAIRSGNIKQYLYLSIYKITAESVERVVPELQDRITWGWGWADEETFRFIEQDSIVSNLIEYNIIQQTEVKIPNVTVVTTNPFIVQYSLDGVTYLEVINSENKRFTLYQGNLNTFYNVLKTPAEGFLLFEKAIPNQPYKLISADGRTLWENQSSGTVQISNINLDNQDYLLLKIVQAQSFQLNVLNTATGDIFPIPSELAKQLPFTSSEVYLQEIHIFPSLDERQLALMFWDASNSHFDIFHLNLENQTWNKDFSDSGTGVILKQVWSPDSQYIAFGLRHHPMQLGSQLMVISADGSQIWDVGNFEGHRWWETMEWSRCGLSPLP